MPDEGYYILLTNERRKQAGKEVADALSLPNNGGSLGPFLLSDRQRVDIILCLVNDRAQQLANKGPVPILNSLSFQRAYQAYLERQSNPQRPIRLREFATA